MAYGRKTGGRDIQKGQVLNPKGRPKISQEVREARKLTQVEFEKACGKLLFMDVDGIKALVGDHKTPMIEAIIGKILLKAMNESSKVELNYFVERFLGKVAENTHITGNLNSTLTDFIAARKALDKEHESE